MSARPIEARDPQGPPAYVAARSPTQPRSPARTRTRRAWGAITLGLATLLVVLVFALQNLRRVEVSFLSLHGRLPLAILLLLVAVLGALVVFAFGAARIVQLRVEGRRSRRRA
jgi:uncharacterized integral membrane protein